MSIMVIALNQCQHPLTSAETTSRRRVGFGALMFTAIALLTVILMSVPLPAVAQNGPSGNGEGRRVVILNSTDPYLPAFVEIDRGLREAIREHSGPLTELNAETLDMARFPGESFNDEIVALLKKKYHRLKVNVVVALGSIALEFAELHKEKIWPGATIVFSSVPTDLLINRFSTYTE